VAITVAEDRRLFLISKDESFAARQNRVKLLEVARQCLHFKCPLNINKKRYEYDILAICFSGIVSPLTLIHILQELKVGRKR
jgi:hypothetical protein